MSIFDHFPYTNMYNLNLDWIIAELKKVLKTAEDLDSAVKILTDQVDDAVAKQLQTWLDDGTLATLLASGVKNVKNFGAKGDGINNDREAINKALSGGGIIYFPAGVYMVDGFGVGYGDTLIGKGLIVNSNSRIVLDPRAEIKILQGTANKRSTIFNLRGVENVEISGGVVTGDSTTHVYSGGDSPSDEWNHLIMLSGSENIRIHDMTLRQATGDGIYIGQDVSQGEPSRNNRLVTLQNIIIDTIGRNGVSVCSVDGCTIDNCSITNVYRTAPKAAVDVEKEGDYTATKSLTQVVITNLHGTDCYYSILAYAADDVITIHDMFHNSGLYAYCDCNIDNAKNAFVDFGANVLCTNSTIRSLNFLQDTSKQLTFKNCTIVAMGEIHGAQPGRANFYNCKLPGGHYYNCPLTFDSCTFEGNTDVGYFVYLNPRSTTSIVRNCTFIRPANKVLTCIANTGTSKDAIIMGCTTIAPDAIGTFFNGTGGEICTQNDCRKWANINGQTLATGCVNYK